MQIKNIPGDGASFVEIVDDRFFDRVPLVSVFCNTFNQAAYIEDCIRSIVAQKTSFSFEVLVTDDASTDGTVDVLKALAGEYPELIRVILHDSNQYSRGVEHNRNFLYPIARGEYFSFCEGDDFWLDTDKLQLQYESMASRPTASWCVHASEYVNASNKEVLWVSRKYDKDTLLSFAATGSEIQLAATSSFFVRREVYEQYLQAAPSRVRCHGDFRMSRFFSIVGDTLYLARVMSAYRVYASNSINSSISRRANWRKIAIDLTESRVNYLKALDSWSRNKHHYSIQTQIDDLQYTMALQTRQRRVLLSRWSERYLTEPLSVKIKIYVLHMFPVVEDCLRWIRARYFPYLGMKR